MLDNSRRPREPMTMETGHSDIVSEGIRVQVAAQYLPEQSSPQHRRYCYAYRVRIINEGQEAAKLISRRWVITNAKGEVEVVEGPGVVGKQPRLVPGERHEYMSGCPLDTEWGTMEGHYLMRRDNGETFEANVARFFLAKNTARISSQD